MAAAVLLASPPEAIGGVSEDVYSHDSLELARATEALRTVVGRLQTRLAADRRAVLAERAALASERESVRQDRERADRAIIATERASAALEQAAMKAIAQSVPTGAPVTATQVPMVVANGACDATAQDIGTLASNDVPPRPRRSPPPVKDASQQLPGDLASPPVPQEVSPTPTSSSTATPSELQASGMRPVARCKEPPTHIKRPAVLSANGATSNASSTGSPLLSNQVPSPSGVRGPKSPPVLPAASPQAPASIASTASSAPPAAAVPAVVAAASSVEVAQPLEQEEDVVRDELDDVDDDIADLDGPPAKAPPPQSPFYRVMPAPKPTGRELAATLPPPAAALPIAVADEGPVPTKAMPAKCRALPESCPPGAPSAASLAVASASPPQHKGRYKAPPAELASRPADGERWAEVETDAPVATARVKAPPVAATRVKAAPAACPVRQGPQEVEQRKGPQVRTKAFPGGPPALAA